MGYINMKKRITAIVLAAMLILTMPVIVVGCPGGGGPGGGPPCDCGGPLRAICIPCGDYDYEYPAKPDDTP